ncbi:hypothetical protein CRYUN_Cryun13aG0027300 [Craigia yunnanensis]
MYAQGNHNPQPGQGPQKPMSSPYQQRLPAPPPPLPQFQQGPSGFTSYQHGPAAPHQITPGTQKSHNMPQPVLPPPISASHPEVSQTQPSFRALPPPPPPWRTFYRAPVNPPPQHPGLQHISSNPPLPPTTSFFTSAPLGSFAHSIGGDHHVLSTAPLPPPPPPSSPPPILPSPPPSTSTDFSSSKPVQNTSNLPCNLGSDDSKLGASGSLKEVVAPNQVKHNLIAGNGSLNMGGGNGCDMVSLIGDKFSLQEVLIVDLSSTPPKPTDENVIERIEALCQGIAKNGTDYEDMVRKNESGKPEYVFLYGGEPGSEAAIAHDFFQWMKKKSILACKLDEQQGDSSLRSSENESSEQPCHLVIAAASHSPDDSDMEMEDDITQIDDGQGMNHSLKGLNSQCDISDNMLNVEGQLHPLQISTECNAYKDILLEKVSAAGISRLGEQGPEGINNADQMTFGASVSKVNLVKLAVPTEQPLVTSLEKSNNYSQLAKDGSPFGLLQSYASDDNSEKDVETGVENTNVSFGANLGRDTGSTLENASISHQTEKGFGPLSLSSMPCAVLSSEVVEGTITISIINGNEYVDNKHVHQVSANHAASGEVLLKENVMVDASVDSVKFSKEHRQEEENVTLGSQHKVDKFGRLVRNGASDSDSDDSRYIGRCRRGRTRSRSQSHSPPGRRKRRSPRRRREKRSLSRSWSPRNRRSRGRSPRNWRSRSRSPRNWRSRSRSPRNRRSRSRSPNFCHADEFSGENKRRVKGQMPICFDFRRGRCYRGVSCRYLHHDSGKSDESRQQRVKQHCLEFPHSSRTNVREEIKWISEKVGDHEHREVRGPEVKPYGNFVASRDRNTNQKREDSFCGGLHNQDGQSTEYHIVSSEKSRDIPPSVFETHLVENKQYGPNLVSNENCQEAAAESHHPSTVDASSVGDIDTLKSCGNASQKILTSFKKSLPGPLDPVCQNDDCLPQQSDNTSISDSSLHKTSTSSPNRLRESNSHPNTMELHNHPSHIASPSLPCSYGIDNPHTKQQQTASSMFQSSGESFPSFMLPNQPSYFALQPNSSLTSLPPPPPLPPQGSTVTPCVSSHFWQSHLPMRNDFGSQIIPRPYPTELPAHSQSDGFQQQAYLPIQEANRPFSHASLPVYNLPIQQFGAPSMSGDDTLTQPPIQNVIASNSFVQGNTHRHTIPFSQQFLGNKVQPFPGESLPPGGLSNSSSYIHPYSQQQQPAHSLHHPIVDHIYILPGKMDSSLKDPPDIRDATSHRVDIGGSTGSTFPNPYASTLDQPIDSKYCSDVMQEKDTTYNKTPFILTHPPVDGRGIGSQQATSSPNSARAIGQNFPRSGGDQYDPLFDSIEPSTRLSRKFDYIQKLEVTGDSDILLGLSGSNKPLDMEENNKRKDAGGVASAASADNEEFGETADAEVGAVENGSPSNPVEVNMATGDIEIDQIKSPGKSKTSKDSRSLKLFRVALADFVKEALKPSWQQGNMSKEAFKTIVKKTVDKVSGAMKSHRIPKSRAKIDQYIESSRQKLTKLVMERPSNSMKKMEGKSVSDSSISNVKLSRSQKKKMKKRRKHEAIVNGNAESEEKETSLGTYSKLDSEANVSLGRENSLTKDAHLETEQFTRSCRKKKRKESSLIDEKQSDSFMESKVNVSLESEIDSNVETVENFGLQSGLKGNRLNEQTTHSERKRKRRKERKVGPESFVELRDGKENSLIDEKQSDSHLESGLKGVQLNEQPADSERKRKSKKELKMAKAGQFEKLDWKSVVELRDGKKNSLIDEKQSDCHLESKLNVNLESGLKEEANSLMQDTLLERDSHVETLEKNSLESGFKGSHLNEQPADSKRKRKRKGEQKMDEAGQFKNLDAKSVLELRDSKENSLIDEKLSDFHVESKVSVSLESGLKEGENSDLGILENISLESGLKGTELNEQTVQSESKSKWKRKRERQKKRRLSVLEDKDISSKRNDKDSNEAENNNTCPAQVLEETFGNSTGSKAALKGRKRKKRKKLKESLCKYSDQKDVEIETKEELIPSPSNLAVAKDDVALKATVKENNLSRTLYSSLERIYICHPKKKLLVLDLNGILVDVVQNRGELQPDITVSGKGVFKRPFCDDFLHFCFSTFNVGIWSSRASKNVSRLVNFLMRKWRRDLFFCWNRRQCTITEFKTIEDKQKPLVLKELRKLWERHLNDLPWKKGEYDESNTLLLDDSPYKALRNPANTAVFPYPYQYRDAKDSSLGRGGDIRKYLEGLAAAENAQKYVEQNPFGQPAITETNPHWDFYCKIIDNKMRQAQGWSLEVSMLQVKVNVSTSKYGPKLTLLTAKSMDNSN